MYVMGHSGCRIELLDHGIVRKSAVVPYAGRLKKQIEKQKQFLESSQVAQIKTPHIRAEMETADSYHADMDFIGGKDFVQFLTDADRPALDRFLQVIIEYIFSNLRKSHEVDVSDAIGLKLDELQSRGVPGAYVHAVRLMNAGPVIVPVGPCHGDLTLSNMLFKADNLFLIDFLDCFVESPLQDIAKLRQDTCFGWSLRMYTAEFDRTKIQIALRYLDHAIQVAFSSQATCVGHYELFQLLNLMRIIPYCTSDVTREHVMTSIDRVLSDRNAMRSIGNRTGSPEPALKTL